MFHLFCALQLLRLLRDGRMLRLGNGLLLGNLLLKFHFSLLLRTYDPIHRTEKNGFIGYLAKLN